MTLSQAATLAAIIRGPIYSPTASSGARAGAKESGTRFDGGDGKITRRAICREEGALGLHIPGSQNDLAPYFVEDIRQYLEHTYGTAAVHEQGLRVYTTLNVQAAEGGGQGAA